LLLFLQKKKGLPFQYVIGVHHTDWYSDSMKLGSLLGPHAIAQGTNPSAVINSDVEGQR